MTGGSLRALSRDTLLWLLLAGALGLGFAVSTSWSALVNPLVVHDDVRQHVFWVPRLHDPTLFPNDPIADYYQAQSPPGFQAVYWLATPAVDAIVASKLLPLLLTVLLTGAGFALGRALWGRADAAALGAILLTWSAWQYDDVASATPRAFAMPLLAAQLAALGAGRLWLALGVLVLTALLYPLGCALMAVTTGLWLIWQALMPAGSTHPPPEPPEAGQPSARGPAEEDSRVGRTRAGARARIRAALPGLLRLGGATLIALVIVALGLRASDRFGPHVTLEQAREMSEFQPGGRSSYFIPDPYRFWLESTRSGLALVPKDRLLGGLPALTIPFAMAAGLGCWIVLGRFGWTARPAVPGGGRLLLALVIASLLLFEAAHLLLFALYLPARHVQFSLPIVWALAGALCWTLLGDRLAARFGSVSPQLRRRLPALFVLAGAGLLILHAPPTGEFYVTGRHPALYAYLQATPPDTLVAALPTDASILPLFGRRPVLTSFEHALPYRLGYYEPLRARTRALMAAYYAPTLAPLAGLIEAERIGVVIANVAALDRRRRDRPDRPPALATVLERCGAFRERDLVALPAACVEAAASASP